MPALTEQDISVIKATAGVVAEHATQITTVFYASLLNKHPELKAFFNASNQCQGAQAKALSAAVVEYALNIDTLGNLGPLLERINHRHVALNIQPEHYPIVHANLMAAIGEVLGAAVTPEIGQAWGNAVTFLAEVCIEAEKALAAKLADRQGGWIGEKEFELSDRVDMASGVVSFQFKRKDYSGGYDFTPGQYLTLRVGSRAPRHYTITSKSGADVLQCTVKNVSKEGLSNQIHESLKIGDKVLLGAPAGVYKAHTPDKPKVLISAGIGITTTWAFLQGHKPQVVRIVHVDRTEANVPWLSDLGKSGIECDFFYTSQHGRLNPQKLLEKTLSSVKGETEFYICGPTKFMQDCAHYLNSEGHNKIFTEIFGTGEIAKCPVANAA